MVKHREQYTIFAITCNTSAPLQYSCLENPMDRGAWWAAVHGVVKCQTQLKKLSSSLSSSSSSNISEPKKEYIHIFK